MRARVPLVVALVAGAGLALMSSGDYVGEYTIVNDTSHDLLTWGRLTACDDPIRWRDEYLPTKLVPAHSTYHYVRSTGTNIKCAQVATTDRCLVLSNPKTLDATYAVSEPLHPSEDPVPDRNSLPSRQGWQTFRENSLEERVRQSIFWLLYAVVITGLSVAVIMSRRGRKGAGRVLVLIALGGGFALAWLASGIYVVGPRDGLLAAGIASLALAAVTALFVVGRHRWRFASDADPSFPW